MPYYIVHRTINRTGSEDEYLVPYVPDALMELAFKTIHSSPTAGHSGSERTIKLFKRNYYNKNETELVTTMCTNCKSCIKAKAHPKPVPMGKYPIPQRPFHTINVDLLGPLRMTASGNRYVLAARDFTTRYTVLLALENKDADSVIDALRIITSHYGSSNTILTDNGKEFVNDKIKRFCELYNIEKIEVSPYHSASSGLVERINREINKLLRIYTDDLALHDWDELLPILQLTINNTFNVSLGDTPFFNLYGYDSPSVTLVAPKHSYSDDYVHLDRLNKIRKHARAKLLEAQEKYLKNANQKRKQKNLVIGARVFAKLPVNLSQAKKLDLPISGPFIVVGKRGRAYKLVCETTKTEILVHPDRIISPDKTVDDLSKTVTGEKISKDNNMPAHKYNLRKRK